MEKDNKDYKESDMTEQQVLDKLKSSIRGLDDHEVRRRQTEFGLNHIISQKKRSPLELFISQFKNLVIYILIAAAAISGVLGNTKDMIGIIIAVILSGTIGFVQEYRSEKALEYLKKLTVQKVRVRRNNIEILIDSYDLVPGDIIIIEEGMKVPADIRLLSSVDIYANESMLTGESVPVEKSHATAKNNILYAGTIVQVGRGEGLVITTGMKTAFGKIAELVAENEQEQTPLQKNLNELGRKTGYLIIALITVFFFYGLFFLNKNIVNILTTSVILGVAGVSEGLPTVIAITLALGMQQMAKNNAVVKRMSAIEDLGVITTICTDKTGTLTLNSMTPKYLYVNGKEFIISDNNEFENDAYNVAYKPLIDMLFRIASVANTASLDANGNGVGDPTELCLLKAASIYGLEPFKIKPTYKILHENRFDSDRKMMSVVAEEREHKFLFVKGAIESVIERSTHFMETNGIMPIDQKLKKSIIASAEKIAVKGMRLIGFGYKKLKKNEDYKNETGLVFVGFIGMYDPPRKEAKESLLKCNQAGINVFMVTGDAKETALNIAAETGFESTNSMSGLEFSELKIEAKRKALAKTKIFYRVSPVQKYDIVSTIKSMGEVVAVTGDGVNDAPAIKKADIGIAMGITGSDVTKEAASIILLDDNFTTIIGAIEYGRKIYDNILNFIRFQFTTTIALLATMFMAGVLYLPDPLKPIHILFINIIMDGPPALALGVEPTNKSVMEKKPRNPNAPYIDDRMLMTIGLSAIFMSFLVLLVLMYMKLANFSADKYITFSFVIMVCLQLFNAFNCRSMEQSGFANITKNKVLVASVGVSFAILIASLYWKPLKDIMQTSELEPFEIFQCILIASSIFVFDEGRKKILGFVSTYFRKRKNLHNQQAI